MENIFGLSVSQLAYGLLAVLAVMLLAIAFYAVRNRFLIRLSLRNIPRRRAQTVLIIVGLMLSTTIIAASLSIGDTIAVSIRNAVLNGVGDTDILVQKPDLGPFLIGPAEESTLTAEEIEEIAQLAYQDQRIDGIAPFAEETLPVINQRTKLTQARTIVAGYDVEGVNGTYRPQSEGGPSSESRLSPFTLNPSVEGEEIDFASLTDNEALLNRFLGEELDAQPGDSLTIVTPAGRTDVRVRGIMEIGGLASNDQRMLMPLSTFHRIMGSDPSTAETVAISIDVDNYDIHETSDEIVDDFRVRFTDEEIASYLHSELRSLDPIIPALEAYVEEESASGGALNENDIGEMQNFIDELKRDEPTAGFRVLVVDSSTIGHLISAITATGNQAILENLPALTVTLAQIERLSATGIKAFLLDIAEQVGNIFVTFFTFFGSFSVIVGLLLIFLIFVLLASERQQEMGIARAVGTKRGHLVQMFTFEGLAYAIGAAAVGTLVGIGAGRALVGLMARAFGTDADPAFSLDFSITIYSIISAFSVGLVLTLITVIFSAYRVSNLNIVVAIRNLPEEFVASTTAPLKDRIRNFIYWIFGPIYMIVQLIRAVRRHEDVGIPLLKLVFTLLIIGWLIGLIASFIRIFSPYLSQGWPLAIIGIALAAYGLSGDIAWQSYVGASIAIYGIGMTALTLANESGLRETVSSRIAYSIVGILILVIWAMPTRFASKVTGELDGDIEMFVLAGIWMVASAVWVVMYNSDLIVRGLQSTLGRINALRPILKPAVAYAVANRFRTGLTVAMFALVIFVLMAFSVLNNSFSALTSSPELITGGFDIRAEISPELQIEDISSVIAEAPELDIDDFTLIAAQSDLAGKARQIGSEDPRYLSLVVRGSEADYYSSTEFRVQNADPAYLPEGIDSEDQAAVSRAIWDAVANDPTLSVITSDHVADLEQFGQGFSDILLLENVDTSDGNFVAQEIEIAPASATSLSATTKRTVIAVADTNADSLEGDVGGGPAPGFVGLYTRLDVFDEISEEPVPFTFYRIKLDPSADAGRIAATMETVFLDHSMLAIDTRDEVQTAVSQNEQFSLLFQGFMGLGLVVGVASLGVLSLRAVNERRMQIAIMRAIGYRARMVRIQFIMEALFITVIGTGLGLALGALLSWSFLDDFSEQAQGLEFSIPWFTVTAVVTITIIAALITTYVPARQASQIYPAEALRYE